MRYWVKLYEKLIFFAPVLIVIAIASVLVYCTYQANFVITATIVAEEGTGSEAASAGIINALSFILPAIIGGFIIALLFKYRKKLTLKFFFGGALFFAGAFISFFFGDSILYLLQTRFYGLFILDFDPYNIEIFGLQPFFISNEIYFFMIILCGIFSFWLTYIITSRKFMQSSKNYSLLVQSALMGAFLSVILPTYTVIILLIALSIYDIYSVRKGPIKDIVKYTMEDEDRYYNNLNNSNPRSPTANSNLKSGFNETQNIFATVFSISLKTKFSNKFRRLIKSKQGSKKIRGIDYKNDYKSSNFGDDSDFMLNSMTYSARDWDVGIGDLVFYSMLASQPLTPYFILNHGTTLLDSYGLWIFWLISIFTIIGILIGFVITIHLLERNSMLPGLPCSIALGLTGFLGSTLILSML